MTESERGKRLALLARVSEQLVLRPATDSATLEHVFGELAATLGYELFLHFRAGDVPHTLKLAASLGLTPAQREQYAEIGVGDTLCGLAAQRVEPLVVERAQESTMAQAASLCADGVRCFVGVPLVAHGVMLGTASLATRRRDTLADGELQLIHTVCRQVAAQLARSRTEQQLRERETLLRLAMDASLAIVFEWDARHDRVRRLLSDEPMLPETGATHSTLADVARVVHADDRERFLRDVDAALVSETGSYHTEIRIERPDGSVRWVEERGRVSFDAQRQPLKLLGVSIDVTDRKRVEEQLHQALHYYEMFTGVLSHDLRTPLGAVLGSAELGLHKTTAPELVRSFERIRNSGERMLRMIEQLLDVTRIRAANGLELGRAQVNLRTICKTAIDELHGRHPGARVLLEVQGDATGQWDPDRISQLITNLVGNAIEHVAQDRVVSVALDGSAAAEVVIRIHNEGTIPDTLLPVLFDPFKRAAVAGRRSAGLGLGLYIAREIALAHGGDVHVASSAEHGTTFEIALPRAMHAEDSAQTHRPSVAPLLRRDAPR